MSAVAAGPAPAVGKHAPIVIIRDHNGNPVPSVAREAEFESGNWSGYALPTFQTKVKAYLTAQATWIVPEVFFDGTNSASSSWIGIGGFCKNKRCSKTSIDRTLIQLGTEQDATGGGTNYYAWYELIPASETLTTLEVNPGDVVTASLTCAGNCKKKQTWTLSMTNETSGLIWSKVVMYKSSKLSVEVIEEAPTDRSGILPLADFGTANFSQISAAGDDVDLSKGTNIVMMNPHGQSSNVSAPNSARDGFDACFSPDSSLTSCFDTSP